MPWEGAIAIAALLNLAGAAALIFWMRHLLVEMPFAALLRQLRGEDPLLPGEPPPNAH
jgi:hypothetical protein